MEIYLFVSRFIYFHTLCLRETWTLVCLGVCADSSKCSLLADAVSTLCRPNMSTNPKPFGACNSLSRVSSGLIRLSLSEILQVFNFYHGRIQRGERGLDPPPGKSQVILVFPIGDKQLDPPPPCKMFEFHPLEKCWIPSGTSENDSLL